MEGECVVGDAKAGTDARAEQLARRSAIDCHCHIYPEKIAARAVESVGAFYNIAMDVPAGTADSLLATCAGSPIERFIVHSVAVRPDNVEAINDFIAAQCAAHPEFVGFATMHQDYPDPEAEIERAIGLGLRGLKLHPDTQAVNMDDARLMRVYEIIEGRLPLIVHTGDYRYGYSHPARLKRVLHAFPNLVVDAAHFGGWSVYDLAVEYLEDERCFLDMSSAQAFLGPRRTAELVRIYGTDRIMFGSDFPMWNPLDEYAMFTALPFSDAEFDQMLRGNAERFLASFTG